MSSTQGAVRTQSLAGEPVLFQVAVEGVLKAFKSRFTPRLVEQLRGLGVDPSALQPGYPLDTWEGMVRLISAELWPTLAPEDAWEAMGRQFMDGYLETLVGRAALAMGKVIGPQRLLERMGRNFRTVGNYTEVHTTPVGPTEAELRIRMIDEFIPQRSGKATVMVRYRQGVLFRSLEAIGARDVSVEVLSWNPATQEARFRARWKE